MRIQDHLNAIGGGAVAQRWTPLQLAVEAVAGVNPLKSVTDKMNRQLKSKGMR